MSCVADGTRVDLWYTDDGSKRQEWDITLVPGFNDVYNIKVHGGVAGNRVFLSCRQDGSVVDLWHEDDGCGRQRWHFVPVNGSKICQLL
ncbi:MAG TPA: hypothetical protein VI756_15940 [Blastocatellia bacterium]